MPTKTASKNHTLHLNLHRQHFAEIVAGSKRVEYRDVSPYWTKRLKGRDYEVVQFRNGYATKAPEMRVQFKGVRKVRKCGEPYYAIKLGRILSLKRWRQ